MKNSDKEIFTFTVEEALAKIILEQLTKTFIEKGFSKTGEYISPERPDIIEFSKDGEIVIVETKSIGLTTNITIKGKISSLKALRMDLLIDTLFYTMQKLISSLFSEKDISNESWNNLHKRFKDIVSEMLTHLAEK